MNDPSQRRASSEEQIRVCESCGHLNPADESARCDRCWLPLTWVAAVGRVEGEQLVRVQRRRLLRRRVMVRAVPLAVALGLGFWALSQFVHLGPNPPGATTTISADLGPGTWAQARRTPQNSAFISGQAPIPRTVAWIYDTSGTFSASPAIVGDRIYITSDDGRTVALDRRTGQPVWEHSSGHSASSTPAVADGLVIVTLRPGLVVGLDRDTGEMRWETDLKHGVFSSPIVADGSAFVGAADSNLHALDIATGIERWVFSTNDWVVSPVAYADGTVVVASQGSLVYIVDAGTGRKRLQFDTGFQRFGGGPTIQDDTVYFSSDRGLIWAIDRTAKTYPLQRLIFHLKINLYVWQVIPEPPLQPGALWSRQVDGEIRDLLAVAHDTVYGATRQGEVFALDAATGTPKWSTGVGAVISTAPTVAGDTVLVGTKSGVVFGLEAATGESLWEFGIGHEIADSVIVVGGTMYVTSADGKLYAVTGAE
ncbi:MAG: PQQ-binding-like beta-propeller repeat protein [Chloroflexi bacterium]|nr:PQQ-binding-like beta-propeller repeat protein [Chloroflexota bacterium]